ncbi:hypothetical protein MMC21_005830 [Puttea exsequens]|nr:hypothetical protein [Puttea exsequens]
MSHTDLTLKPIIREIVRTKVCFPDVQLLVDRIDVVRLPSAEEQSPDANEAYILYLTDRDVVIQGLLAINFAQDPRMTYLANANRLTGEGSIIYFAILDFFSIGHDGRTPVSSPLLREQVKKRTRSTDPSAPESPPAKTAKIGPNDNPSSKTLKNLPPVPAVTDPAALEHHARCHRNSDGSLASHCYSFSPYAKRALDSGNPLRPITRPLKLNSLISITGPHASRNKTIDVLALITAVVPTTIQRKGLPTYRDIQIIDPSVDHDVTLSVFVDPEDCVMGVGEVVLLRSVTTHEYKGGKLNAYPQHCRGREWCLPWPYCVEGVQGEMREMEVFRGRRGG